MAENYQKGNRSMHSINACRYLFYNVGSIFSDAIMVRLKLYQGTFIGDTLRCYVDNEGF